MLAEEIAPEEKVAPDEEVAPEEEAVQTEHVAPEKEENLFPHADVSPPTFCV